MRLSVRERGEAGSSRYVTDSVGSRYQNGRRLKQAWQYMEKNQIVKKKHTQNKNKWNENNKSVELSALDNEVKVWSPFQTGEM